MAKTEREELDEASAKWVEEQENIMEEGVTLVKKASDEALEYVADAIENINDKQWRKMTMETQAVEMGVGTALAEHLVHNIYDDMEKNLHKRLKVKKATATALRHIYIGRVMKNIRKALNERYQQDN
jgi:hypothetical protein